MMFEPDTYEKIIADILKKQEEDGEDGEDDDPSELSSSGTERTEPENPANNGRLMLDATVAPADIRTICPCLTNPSKTWNAS
jgi:hypothetical protein